MKEIIGREKELLVTPSGKRVHGAAFFTFLLSEIENVNVIKDYQIVQVSKDYIVINLVARDTISEKK